jgi:hypothetical protein
MTNKFDDYLCDGVDVIILSLVHVITISFSHSLSKVFCCNFLVTTRKIEILKFCSVRDRAGRRAMRLVTS